MWKKLYASLKIGDPEGKPLPKPTAEDLDNAEKALKAKLPASYREFAQEFGFGEHAQYYRIYVPFKSPKFKESDLARLAIEIREGMADVADKKEDKEFYRRMIPFADTIGGDLFAFDPKAAQGKDPADYPVFVMIRGRDKIEPLSPDFATFVNDVVYGKGMAKVMKSMEQMPITLEFLPYDTETAGV